jgi:hypothetical protein
LVLSFGVAIGWSQHSGAAIVQNSDLNSTMALDEIHGFG